MGVVTNQEEIEACWHIDNLQYIPAKENMSKGHRLSLQDIKGFSETQLKILAKASRKPQFFNAVLKDVSVFSCKVLPIKSIQLSLDI